jgi:O-acetyl-ADP-ribose deacetylase
VRIEVLIGDIANQQDIEAVVNSANANLRLGSGVAGAIHQAAGPELEKYCQPFAPLALGMAILTPAFNLPNKYVIHTRAGHYLFDDNAEVVLASCMASVFKLALDNQIRSVALPAVGTGVFKFPPDLCASIMVNGLKAYIESPFDLVRFCVVNTEMQSLFWDALDEHSLDYS